MNKPELTGWAQVPKFNERTPEHLATIPRFSFFEPPIQNIHPKKEINLMDVFFLIRNESKKQTHELREATEKKIQRKIKASKFSYVTFSGVFSSRNDHSLLKHSGLICLDFDNLPDVQTVRETLLSDYYFPTELLFVSPSGDGLKWVIKIDITKNSHQEWHHAIGNYLNQTYGLKIDSAGKDVSRACFLPNDPMLYLNPHY